MYLFNPVVIMCNLKLIILFQDSMGKDGTQLLRHCLRLLVRVSTDLLAVRVSGIFHHCAQTVLLLLCS